MYKIKNALLHGLLMTSLMSIPALYGAGGGGEDLGTSTSTSTGGARTNIPSTDFQTGAESYDMGTGTHGAPSKYNYNPTAPGAGGNPSHYGTQTSDGLSVGGPAWIYYGRPYYYQPYYYYYPYRPYFYHYYNYPFRPYYYRYGW